MIEGREDTHFRIYRESNPALKTNTWWSVADSIPAAKELAEKLKEDGTRASKRLHDAIQSAIPRLEAGEEVCATGIEKAILTIHRNASGVTIA
jgi:hypothetical protein